jgi:hypothetical protein
MNSLLLVVLVSCPPVAAYPDAGPAQDGSSHQGRPRLFGWLRGHHRHNKYPSAGNGTVEALTLEPVPTVVPPPACHCAGNGHAGGSWPPVAAAPAPTVVPPPATAGPAPRLLPRPQPETTSTEPPLAVPRDGALRLMPRGPVGTTGAEPPRN